MNVATPDGPVAPGALGLTGYQWRALILCAATFLVEGYDMSTMAFAAPTISALWNVKATSLSTAIVALNLGAIIGNGFLSPIGDRYSRKWAIVGSTLMLGSCVMVTATASAVWHLVAWRFVSGLAYGIATANVVALIAEQFPRNRRALLVVIAATNLSLGSAIGGFSAAGLTAAAGWPALFLTGGGAGILLAAAMAMLVRPSPKAIDDGEAATVASKVRSVPILRLFEPGMIGVTLSLWVIGFANASILFMMLNWLPTMLTGLGWTLAEATRAPAAVSIGGIFSGILLAILVDHGKATVALRVSFALLIVTMGLFAVVPSSVPVWTAMLFVAGVLCSGSHHVERGLYATLYPQAIRATGVGWGNMMSRLGNVLGTMTVALFIDLHLSVAKTLALMVFPAIVSLVCTVPLGRAYTRHRQIEAGLA